VAGIRVSYEHRLDGGGLFFGGAFVPFVRSHFGKVGRLLEWCSGPGFIGFGLLGEGLCDELGLADVNPQAIDCCNATIRENGLAGVASTHVSDCFDNLSAGRGWDLIVANPPHWCCQEDVRRREEWLDRAYGRDRPMLYGAPIVHPPIIYLDPDWGTHRKFWSQVPDHLSPGGSVLLLEHSAASCLDDFAGMIEPARLTLRGAWPTDGVAAWHDFYFVWASTRAVTDG
jgi:methylase of polypeptide subunit release factors